MVVVPQADLLAAKLHSKYQPQAEADRYIEALNIRQDAGYFILIEPGLGYLVHALKNSRPEGKAVILHADSCFRQTDICPGVPAWYPDSGTGVQEFLENEIPDTGSIQIIEWKHSVRVFGDVYLNLVRESTDFIKRAAASRRTSAAFGKRWVRNFFRNLIILNNTLLYKTTDMPVLITGSGPSLEATLPKILECREGLFIIAASSSLPALASGGINPDMVISTDGGGWALLHLHACFRESPAFLPQSKKLAIALTAAIPSQCSALSVLPISDGSLWQSMALNAVGVPSVYIPQRGTVTASALELAMVLSNGNIFLAGMDLSVNGIRSHARPYGFDHLFFGGASRFRPVYSQLFSRSSDIKAGGSHDVYAAWFNSRLASWPKRIFSIGSSHAAFENRLPESSTGGGKNHDGIFKVISVKGPADNRRKLALDTLIAALCNPQYSTTLAGELAPLLFPSQTNVTEGEIADALYRIAGRGEGSG